MTFVTCRCCRCWLNWVVHCFNIAEIDPLTARQGWRQTWRALVMCSRAQLLTTGTYVQVPRSSCRFFADRVCDNKPSAVKNWRCAPQSECDVSSTLSSGCKSRLSFDTHFRAVVMFTHSLSAFMCRRRRRLSFSYVIRQASFLSVNKRRAFFRHRLT